MTSALITISGYVQGVGYRKFVRQLGRKLGLTGWVQNMPDGTVEAKAFGPKEDIELLITMCKKGSYIAEVKDVKAVWGEEDNVPEDFVVLSST